MKQKYVRTGKTYVAIDRSIASQWWSRPFSEMVAAANSGVLGVNVVVDPGEDREVEEFNETTRQKDKKVIFVEENPYRVKNAMVFRPAGKLDGFDRDDVAALHSQGW